MPFFPITKLAKSKTHFLLRISFLFRVEQVFDKFFPSPSMQKTFPALEAPDNRLRLAINQIKLPKNNFLPKSSRKRCSDLQDLCHRWASRINLMNLAQRNFREQGISRNLEASEKFMKVLSSLRTLQGM